MPVLTMTGGPVSVTFLAAQSDDNGFLFKLPETIEEALDTEGVNGRRWRTKYEQMIPSRLDTLSGCTNFATAVAEAQFHRNLVGTLVSLTWVVGGATYTYKDVHVSAVMARPIAGTVVGGGASSGLDAHVRSSWVLEPTDFHVFAN